MYTSEITGIINQLDQAFDKDPWYGNSIYSVLESVDPNNVFDSPNTGVHSIAELVAHLITYREFTAKRLSGDNDYFTSQEDSFCWQRLHPEKKDAWKHLLEKLVSDHHHLLSLLQKSNDSVLDKKVGGKSYSFRYLLNGIIQHDLYHLGQIAYIRKMQQEKPHPDDVREPYQLFSFESMSFSK